MLPAVQRSSLVAHVCELLRRAIRDKEWSDFLPPERELCARLQVSRKTVRAALAVLHRERLVEIQHAKRTRVLAPPIRDKRSDRSRVFAVLFPDKPMDVLAFNLTHLRALQLEWKAAGYETVFQSSATLTGQQCARRLGELVRQTNAVCWLLLSVSETIQRWFMDEKVPALLGGTPFPDVHLPSMDFDMRAIGVHAAETLLKSGHHRVAVLNPAAPFAGDLRVEEGFGEVFRRQANAHGSPLFLRHDQTVAGLRRVLDGCLNSPHPPTAMLVSGAGHMLTVFSHLLRAGRQVPRDVSLICGDEHRFLSATIPSIAHYVFDWDVHAKRLARATLRLASRGALPHRPVRLYPRFVRGESLGPPKQ